jgi:hypothetical protein
MCTKVYNKLDLVIFYNFSNIFISTSDRTIGISTRRPKYQFLEI